MPKSNPHPYFAVYTNKPPAMLTKDRYSHAFIILIIGFTLALFFLKKDKGIPAAITFVASTFYTAYLFTQPGRLHLTNQQKESYTLQTAPGKQYLYKTAGIKLKAENDCGFSLLVQNHIDGIQTNNTRYKVVNGTDIYLTPTLQPKPAGFGSAIMQKLAGGGTEPPEIQTDPCWK